MGTRPPLQTPEEVAEEALPLKDRAKNQFDRLLEVIAKRRAVAAYVQIGRGRVLDPFREEVVDFKNAPMVDQVKILIQPPSQDAHKHTAHTWHVFQLFNELLWADLEALQEGKGRLFECMQSAKVGKLIVEVFDPKLQRVKKNERIEFVLPKDAR